MLEKYRNIILGVVSFFIFVLLVQLVFVKSIKVQDFTYANYEKKQAAFNSCYGNTLKDKQKELTAFIKQVHTTKNAKDIKTNSLELLHKTTCAVSFVSSNDTQIREMASKVLPYAQEQIQQKDLKLLNTVYTDDELFSAILQRPRSYLFYGMSADQKAMYAFLATPQKDGSLHIQALWDQAHGFNQAYTQNEISKLLYIYNEKIF